MTDMQDGDGRRTIKLAWALLDERRGPVLVAVAAGWFLVSGTRLVIPALLPEIKVAFAIKNATAGLVLTIFWVVYAGMQFPAGVLTDWTGELGVLLVSVQHLVVHGQSSARR
jgi:predicted MFS family arabinose efflux permease